MTSADRRTYGKLDDRWVWDGKVSFGDPVAAVSTSSTSRDPSKPSFGASACYVKGLPISNLESFLEFDSTGLLTNSG